jgi:tetratricopeptide (TPR) repeat protein
MEYRLSPSTKIAGKYQYGIEKFVSTSFLNKSSHWGMLSFSHRFNPQCGVEVYDILERSNQPDVLNTRSVYTFATYTQNLEGVKIHWAATPATLFTLEYYSHQRFYSGLYIGPHARQEDVFHSAGVSWSDLFTPTTYGVIYVGYHVNTSNNAGYRYSEPFLHAYMLHGIGAGFELQLLERLSARSFSKQRVSNDSAVTRSDVINTIMIGIKKNIGKFFALNARYYFQKEFSNEPLRKFTDHSVTLGLELFFGKSASLPFDKNEDELSFTAMSIRMPGQPTAQTLTNLGYVYLLKGEYAKSLEYSLKAIALDSSIAETHTNTGIAYYKLGSRAQAIREWELALKISPGNLKVRSLLEKARSER